MHPLAFSLPVIRQSIYAGLLVLSLLLFSSPKAAADNTPTTPLVPGGFTLQAIGSETGSWESNPLLLVNGAKPLYGSVTSPELIFNSKTPTSQLNVDTLVNENIFNQTSFNSTDIHQKIGLDHQVERWSASIDQATDYDTTRTSELFPTGLNGVIADQAVRHLGLSLAPQIAFSPNTTNKISLAGAIADSQYDNPIFTNYGLASVTPTYTHNFDPQNAGTLSLQAQRYQTTSGPHVTDDSIGPSVGWLTTFTPTLSGKASAGVQTSRQYGSGAVQEPWSLQYIYSADLTFKGEQDTTDLLTSRANYPFGNGTESLLTTFSLSEIHELNPNFSLNGSASYQSATYQSTGPGDLNYLVSGTGALTYHATEHLDIATTYQYRYEALLQTGNAQDNRITLGLVYHPHAWTF